MRADRLLAAVLVLQARGQITAAQLARELGVSERTARRDLEALSGAGVPVYPQRGRDGGWRLLGGYRTDLSGLTVDESRALFLVAGPSAAGTPEVRAALRKLLRALPEPLRAGAEAASAAVVVDPAAWGRQPEETSPFFAVLQGAVVGRRQVRLGYAGPGRPPGVRTIHPYGMAAKGGTWYLLAGTEQGLRTFRLGRVTSAEPLDEAVVMPDGFDLAAEWARVLEQVEGRNEVCQVVVRVDREVARWVRDRYGRRARPSAAHEDDGRITLELGFANERTAASELAGYAEYLEVVSPPGVRDHLARIGWTLTECYSPTADTGAG